MATKTMPVADLSQQTSAIIHHIRENGDIVYITQHGRPTAVLLAYTQYETLIEQAETRQVPTGWPAHFFTHTYGALQNDPLTRREQGDYEVREELL